MHHSDQKGSDDDDEAIGPDGADTLLYVCFTTCHIMISLSFEEQKHDIFYNMFSRSSGSKDEKGKAILKKSTDKKPQDKKGEKLISAEERVPSSSTSWPFMFLSEFFFLLNRT